MICRSPGRKFPEARGAALGILRPWIWLASALVFWLLAGSSEAAVVLQTVALSGQQAPGLATGLIFDSFFLPLLNDSGAVAFNSTISGSTNNETIWTLSAGVLQLAAREGTKAPGVPAGSGTYLYGANLFATGFDNSGNVAFTGDLTATNGVEPTQGLWRGKAGSVKAVALSGGEVPGFAAGYTYQTIANNVPVAQSGGFTAFTGSVSNGTTDADGLWKGVPGTVTLVASTLSQAPGVPAGASFASIFPASLNAAGKVTFAANLLIGSGGVTDASNGGVWSDGLGSLALVARKGDAAAGASGALFDYFGNPQIVSAGRVVFSALLTGPGVDLSNDAGLWRDTSSGLQLLARSGSHAPGTPTGAVFELFDDALVSGSAVAVSGQLRVGPGGVTDDDENGVWLLTSGALTLTVREGDPVPGLFGLTFDPDRGSLMLNSLGHLAFTATLSGNGVSPESNQALLAQDASGALNLVLRTGSAFQLSPGDFRTIQSFAVSTLGSGFTSADSWNDLHQLALTVSFTGGSSGVFLANVPEPASPLLIGTGLLLLAARRRGHRDLLIP